MKKNILTSIGLTTFFAVAIISSNVVFDAGTTSAYAFAGGSPGGKTNSPADGSNCTQCHGGTINSGTGTASVLSAALSGGYVPGQTYTITGTITQNSINKFGFEITAEKDADNSKAGTLIITDATRTKLVNSSNGITHKSGGTSGTGSISWFFDWTAPSAGTGSVTFYGVFNSTNSNGSTSGDEIYTSTLSVTEILNTGINEADDLINIEVYPNPTSDKISFSNYKSITSIAIYSLTGKKVLETKTVNKSMDVSALNTGSYFVKIISNKKEITKKIIIQ